MNGLEAVRLFCEKFESNASGLSTWLTSDGTASL
jgi:hypothetical protein